MTEPLDPGALTGAWRALVERVKAGESALGERLFLLGAGPVPVGGAVGGALTLDRDGGVILVVGLTEPWAAAAHEIGRQLDGIERLPGSKLREAGVDPAEGGGLTSRHAAFFGLDAPVTELNTSQRCIVVLPEDAASEGTATLTDELGDRLGGIYVATETGVTALGGAAVAEPEIVLEPPAEDSAVAEVGDGPYSLPGLPGVGEELAEAQAAEEKAREAADAEEEKVIEAAEAEIAREKAAEAEAGKAGVAAAEVTDTAIPKAEVAEAEGPAAIEVALDEAPEAAPEDEAVPEDEAAPEPEGAAALVEGATGQPVEVFDAYLADESDTVITEESDVGERTGIAAWPIGNWIGLTMVVLGIVLAVIGVLSLQDSETDPQEPPGDPNPLIATVASDVPPDATHARWIGQQRVVFLSDGTLAFVYPTQESLNVVKDELNAGESWGEPFALTEVQPISLSVDVDSKDRLHVAYTDGTSINYVRLKNKPAGWKPSRIIQLDDDTTSPNVDVAWDEQNQTAHVVWVQQSDDGEAPAWAALTNEGGIHLSEEGILASAGTDVPVLVNVAADGRSSLLVTYRRGDQTSGWSSRYSGSRDEDGTWLFEEEEAVPQSSFVGAADVIYDRQKTAHLVLRDSTNYALVYFSKKEGEAWSQAEIALEESKVTAVEFPALSSSAGDGLVYLFFQTDAFYPPGEIAYVVRDPSTESWSEPFSVVNPVDAPEGAQYPVTPDRVEEQALVFWTKTGNPYEVDTAPVQAPITVPTPDESSS